MAIVGTHFALSLPVEIFHFKFPLSKLELTHQHNPSTQPSTAPSTKPKISTQSSPALPFPVTFPYNLPATVNHKTSPIPSISSSTPRNPPMELATLNLNTVYDTASGSITLAGHSAILAFCLITLHTAVVYTYLTAMVLTIQRRYHSKMDGHTQFQVFQTLITAMAATRGMTLWLRENGASDDTHLLHIKRPRSLLEYLVPKVRVLPRSELSAEGPRA